MKIYDSIAVGSFAGDVEKLVKSHSLEFIRLPLGDKDASKWILLNREVTGTYAIILSQQPQNPSYNIMISVLGPNEARTAEIMKDIRQKIGIETREAPEDLKKISRELTMLMEALFKEPTYH
jgi:hypothetical protein